MLHKIFLYFLGITLLTLPLIYSLDTQQIFSVNKFTLVLFFIGISALLFSSAFSYKKKFFKISKNTLYAGGVLTSILTLSTYFSSTPIISFFGSDARHFGALFIFTLFLTFIFTSQIFINNKKNNTIENKIIIPFIFLPLSISGIITAIWAILQYAGYPPVFGGVLNFDSLSARSFAGMGQPNFCAQFLIFPFFISWYFLIKNFIRKNIYFCILHSNILILYAFALYATGSRAGILGVLSGIAVLTTAYISFKLYNKYKYSKYLLHIGVSSITIGIISIFTLIFIYGESISLYLGDRGDSIAARFYFWNNAVELINQNFWTGTGADMMSIPFSQTLSVIALEPENFSATPDRSHSIIFDIFLQYGIFGFLFFIFGIWKITQTALQNIYQSFQNNGEKIDIISIISLAGFIGILTTWVFGFAVITDSFIATLFIALIFRNSIKNNYIPKTIHHNIMNIIIFMIVMIALFLIHTAYTIHQSEKALFPLKNNAQLTDTEKYTLSEKILQTPYLANNLFSVYSQFTDKQKIEAIKMGKKYNIQTSEYYQNIIFTLISHNKKEEALFYLKKLQQNAGNLFTKQIQVTQIAKTYNLISNKEFQREIQNIKQNLIPEYYFNSENHRDSKFQKFWKHHANSMKFLIEYTN